MSLSLSTLKPYPDYKPSGVEEKFSALRILLPPLTEQTAIVEYLEKATADINTATSRAHREIEFLKEYCTRLGG